ncbi:type I phosphodiesterase/nucleotide pyrophosphatase [Salana multivorans]|uniref:Type I phosphodiesterase/nucleotide pyrophosphatase n=1 Tax=Salana multivorans TaxID=120377 RepID=A0A3N2D2H1_9MICO|nr:nucleotide pyrophosphatase/phosphodiesterase family protein [Salana multivorans]ROR93674.1 type I phosphodiesterase/nucleotide pyrophosphatase [Salana multivorans]
MTHPGSPALVPPPGLVLPGPRSLRGVLPDVARAVGLDAPDLPSAGLALPSADRAVVVLVDGLGARQLAARSGHAPTLRGLLNEGERVGSAGYPTTTAASLASFGTGRTPGETGLLGYSVRDPRQGPRGGTELIGLVQWANAAGVPGPEPALWQPHPTVFELLGRAGIATTTLGKARFAGSGLTRAALRGSAFVAADTLDRAVEEARRALRSPGLVYLYWGGLDSVGHHEGWGSAAWGDELEALDAAVTTLLRRLPAGTPLVLTADHGMVDVTERIDVAHSPALREGVALVAGEPRALHLHLDRAEDVADVTARWSDLLGDAAWVLPGEEAIAGGLFGLVEPRNAGLVGDVVVAARGTVAVQDSRTQTPASLTLVGMHGSLTPDEVEIPLLVAVG